MDIEVTKDVIRRAIAGQAVDIPDEREVLLWAECLHRQQPHRFVVVFEVGGDEPEYAEEWLTALIEEGAKNMEPLTDDPEPFSYAIHGGGT